MAEKEGLTCREKIMSEEYRDFIYEQNMPFEMEIVQDGKLCEQEIGFYYRSVYLNKLYTDPITLNRFSYGSIPKCYIPLDTEMLDQAGIAQVQNYPTLKLMGEGVMLGIIDTGIDYLNPIFRNVDGSTRIAGIWDQTIQTGDPPEGFLYGTEYTRGQINEAVRSERSMEIVPSVDEDGHGTFIAGVAAGGENVEEGFLGAAPKATLGIVKLKEAKKYLKQFYFIDDKTKCYQENDIMLGIRYLSLLARKNEMPLVICIALGTNQGDHNGTSPLGHLISNYADVNNTVMILGAGNEANQRHHYYGKKKELNRPESIEIRVAEGVTGFTMEMWTDIPNIFTVSIVSPGGERIPFVPLRQIEAGHVYKFVFENTTVYIDYRLFVERTNSELIFIRMEEPSAGIWKLEVEARRLADGEYHIWLPVKEFLSGEVYFLLPDPDTTVTEPGCVINGITAAYYNGENNSIAIDSGRGYTRNETIKPDFAAPGVEVLSAAKRNQFVRRSGSSIATAVTAGASVLLMEWLYYRMGRRNVDTLQIRNLLLLGTERVDSEEYPNRRWGYGAINLYRTFESLRSF
mgnify:FL=1